MFSPLYNTDPSFTDYSHSRHQIVTFTNFKDIREQLAMLDFQGDEIFTSKKNT